MAHYYTDHPEIAFYLQDPLMRRITELKESLKKTIEELKYLGVRKEDVDDYWN